MQICVPRRGCEENPGALNLALNIQPPDFLHILGEAHSAIFYLQGLTLSTARLAFLRPYLLYFYSTEQFYNFDTNRSPGPPTPGVQNCDSEHLG